MRAIKAICFSFVEDASKGLPVLSSQPLALILLMFEWAVVAEGCYSELSFCKPLDSSLLHRGLNTSLLTGYGSA